MAAGCSQRAASWRSYGRIRLVAKDPAWTEQLGNALLTQRAEVMEAVLRKRIAATTSIRTSIGSYRARGLELVQTQLVLTAVPKTVRWE